MPEKEGIARLRALRPDECYENVGYGDRDAPASGDGGAITAKDAATATTWRDQHGNPRLLYAVIRTKPEEARALMSAGAKIDDPIAGGSTTLHILVENGPAVLVPLVQHAADVGADLDVRGKAGSDRTTPLLLAAQNNRIAAVRALIAGGACVDRGNERSGSTPLLIASQQGHLDVARLLVAAGADVSRYNEPSPGLVSTRGLKSSMMSNASPLTTAAQNGRASVVRFLLEAGASPDARGVDQCVALHSASTGGDHADVARVLAEASADVNAGNSANCAPLHTAANQGRVGVVRALLAAGANVDHRNDQRSTPLHFAAQVGSRAMACATLGLPS